MLDFLPSHIKDALRHLNIYYVYELRLRVNQPTTVNYRGKYQYLGPFGITEIKEKAIQCDQEDISDCIFKAGNYSVYSVEEQLKRGFITAESGERIGIAGEYVFDKGQPITIRNYTSLCIRVPHEVLGCGEKIYQACMYDKLRNLLIASPPGLGKTTILRDLARMIVEKTQKNVLICDERGEIDCGMGVGFCDVLKFADKATAFDAGIRAMRPDVMITDELSVSDCVAVEKAIYAGVCVLASAHFSAMESIKSPFFGLFERYVILDGEHIGKVKAVYDENGKELSI